MQPNRLNVEYLDMNVHDFIPRDNYFFYVLLYFLSHFLIFVPENLIKLKV